MEETVRGKKSEPLAPAVAQSEACCQHGKGLAVNSQLRWAQSTGTASQSPACSPTWETAAASICQLFMVAT